MMGVGRMGSGGTWQWHGAAAAGLPAQQWRAHAPRTVGLEVEGGHGVVKSSNPLVSLRGSGVKAAVWQAAASDQARRRQQQRRRSVDSRGALQRLDLVTQSPMI